MKNIFAKKDKRTEIDKEVERVVTAMSLLTSDSDDYKNHAVNLELLMKARSCNKDQSKISKDVLVTCIFGLVQVLVIVGYEHGHVLVSKAMGSIVKGRV